MFGSPAADDPVWNPASPPPSPQIGSPIAGATKLTDYHHIQKDIISCRWRTGKEGWRGGEFSWPSDVCFDATHQSVIVADYGNKRIQKLSQADGKLQKVITDGEVDPFCVATAAESGNIVTTDQCSKCVKIFCANSGHLLGCWGQGNFIEPSGICQMRSGHWVVTDTQQRTISIYNPDGMCVSQFGSDGTDLNSQVSWPGYVTSDSRGRIIVSDSNNKCVKIFDCSGKHVTSFDTPYYSNDSGKHFCPKGLCVDRYDNILICDWLQVNVGLFNSDGIYLQQIIGIRELMTNPHGIALDLLSGNMAVTVRTIRPHVVLLSPYPYL